MRQPLQIDHKFLTFKYALYIQNLKFLNLNPYCIVGRLIFSFDRFKRDFKSYKIRLHKMSHLTMIALSTVREIVKTLIRGLKFNPQLHHAKIFQVNHDEQDRFLVMSPHFLENLSAEKHQMDLVIESSEFENFFLLRILKN